MKETDHFAPLRHEGGRVGPLADYAATVAHCGDQRWRLEASPAYCYGGEPVVRALRATLQDPRIVLCLRDPVDRLWSNHRDLHSRGSLLPGMDMAAFVAACARLRASGEDRLPRHRAYRGLSIGHYEEYVPIWLDAFGDDLRVVFFDDLVADPAGVVAGLCRWLGIDAAGAAGLVDGAHNRTVRHRSEALRRLAYGLNTLGRLVLRSRSGIVRALRTTYERLNAIPEEPALTPPSAPTWRPPTPPAWPSWPTPCARPATATCPLASPPRRSHRDRARPVGRAVPAPRGRRRRGAPGSPWPARWPAAGCGCRWCWPGRRASTCPCSTPRSRWSTCTPCASSPPPRR